ncbi:MAG: sensor histidine kinase [Gracilimonas sp.]|uniref:sensor histidine kinase n=1 Tax=Gracilimonas sp. TaxID=1974203 RepID=UPI003751356D|nr:sensor histidine kinase [Gracilimonas sp.]
MQRTSEVKKKGHPTHRHLMVVTAFIVAASLLVVLTTFAISMLTATGDLNRLLVRWSQNNGESVEMALSYFENRDDASFRSYRNFTEQRMYTADVISELMSSEPNEDLIFREFNPDDIHPNEITGLIRIFTLFEHTQEIRDIKQTWDSVQQLSLEKSMLIDSLISNRSSLNTFEPVNATLIHAKNREINNYIRAMISDNSGILLLLKRYSLWFTVLLGIIIVLIGMIYTVRGVKHIRNMQELLAERDYLAMFPELNQFPVLNLSIGGDVDFVNQSTRNLFPDLKQLGLSHPFLKEVHSRLPEIISEPEKTMLFEVEVEGKYYQQSAHYLSKANGINLHSIDITNLKNKQLELSHTLKEKESLLAEVHHRVKNNMAVVTGLLELQEMMGQDPNSALSESRSRIKSMAIIHELLYQSDSFSEIKTYQYLTKLGEHLQLSLANIDSVKVKSNSAENTININQAVPLALLLNELATHLSQESSKQGQRLGLLLQIVSQGERLCLQLSSPQSGITNPLKNNDKPTLRMSLIKNLLAQIDGKLNIPEQDNLLIKIKFTPTVKRGSSSTLI